jgi:hypothetical protein
MGTSKRGAATARWGRIVLRQIVLALDRMQVQLSFATQRFLQRERTGSSYPAS